MNATTIRTNARREALEMGLAGAALARYVEIEERLVAIEQASDDDWLAAAQEYDALCIEHEAMWTA